MYSLLLVGGLLWFYSGNRPIRKLCSKHVTQTDHLLIKRSVLRDKSDNKMFMFLDFEFRTTSQTKLIWQMSGPQNIKNTTYKCLKHMQGSGERDIIIVTKDDQDLRMWVIMRSIHLISWLSICQVENIKLVYSSFEFHLISWIWNCLLMV